MKTPRRAFTLIELLVVVGILSLIAAVLLPSLSAAKKRALQLRLRANQSAPALVVPPEASPPGPAGTPARTLASIKSFAATVSLKPRLSIGTSDPESIYTARLTTEFQALDVLGIAPIDRLGELTWLGPVSVVLFGLVLGLVAYAFNLRNFDRWMLLLILGTFTGAYPLMYFAQEFIPLNAAMFAASAVVLAVIGIRSVTIIGVKLGFFGTLLPAASILLVTLLAAVHSRLQGLLLTAVGIVFFIVAMLLMPRLKLPKSLGAHLAPV